ncbi:MAG: hypothetical protein ACR2IF_04550 [Terriglobales bacterium]
MLTSVLLAAIAATAAAWAALLCLLRSQVSLRESLKAVNIAQRALDEAAALHAPLLLFSCEAVEERGRPDVWITTYNSGYKPTEILNGRIILRVRGQGEGEITRELRNVAIAGRREYVVRLRLDPGALDCEESGPAPVEISCEATYSREGEPNAYACDFFRYDPRYRIFLHNFRGQEPSAEGHVSTNVPTPATPLQ